MPLLREDAMVLLSPESVYAERAIFPPLHLTIYLPQEYSYPNPGKKGGTCWPYLNLQARAIVKPMDGIRTRGLLIGETEVTGLMTLLPEDTTGYRTNMYSFIWKHGSEEDGPRFSSRADDDRWKVRVDIFHEGEKIGECESAWIWVYSARHERDG